MAKQNGGRHTAEKLGRVKLGMVIVALLLPVLLVSEVAQAHRKTDVITLYNGDRITGEIKSLLNGRISLSTDSMGTVNIEWKDVSSVDSNYNYELRLADGSRYFGTVSPSDKPGVITFEDVFKERRFSWMEVVELRPVEEKVGDRIDIYISANYAFTKASGVTQTELRADVSYEDEDALNTLNSRATVSDTDSETTASSRVTLSRRAWTDRQAMYRSVFGGYESNDELALDYRFTIGGGLGRYFIDTNNQNLNAGLSIQALEERSVGGDQQESIEGVISVGYSRWRFDSPKLNLQLDASLYPSLTERGRLRADSNARLRWEMIDDLYWDLSAWGSFDNETIDEGGDNFDWGITTGLGWEF